MSEPEIVKWKWSFFLSHVMLEDGELDLIYFTSFSLVIWFVVVVMMVLSRLVVEVFLLVIALAFELNVLCTTSFPP